MINVPYPNRLERTQIGMIRVLNEQIECPNQNDERLLKDFNKEQLELIGQFVLSFYK